MNLGVSSLFNSLNTIYLLVILFYLSWPLFCNNTWRI
uniref:Uncharacterized protein n=1 Tax=Anguilla anguilla TaxID=7936 RepID=A0A0E9RIJ2_ANGAN